MWSLASLLAYFYAEEEYVPKDYFILFASLSYFLSAIVGGNLRAGSRTSESLNRGLSKFAGVLPLLFIASFYFVVFSRFSFSMILDVASFRDYLVADDGANYGLLGRLALLSLFSSSFLLLKNKKYFILASLACVPMVFLLSAKTLILFYLSAVLVLTPKRLKLSKVALIGGVFIFCFIMTMSMRYPDASFNTIAFYIYNYLSGGLLALSQLNDVHSVQFGYYSFRNIYLWMNVFYPYPVASIIQDWANVPFPTNIYTYLRPYYMDFGWFALFFTCLFGFVSGKIYSQKYKNIRVYYMIYPIVLYATLMQIFDDQYLTWLSNWIVLIFIGFIMTRERYSEKNSSTNHHI
jgi:oligosaccharide repeat unit polymerase